MMKNDVPQATNVCKYYFFAIFVTGGINAKLNTRNQLCFQLVNITKNANLHVVCVIYVTTKKPQP